jgi:ribonuclease R
MARKKTTRRPRRYNRKNSTPAGKRPAAPLLSERLLAFLSKQKAPLSLADLLKGFQPAKNERKAIPGTLRALEKGGKLRRKKKKWLIADRQDLVKAQLSLTAKGFGFAVLEGNSPRQQKDIFIPPTAINGATHGDTVLVRIVSGSRGRSEGRIIEVLKRGFSRLCGIYTSDGKTGHVTPDNDKMPFTVLIKRTNSLNASNGTAVLVEIIDYGTSHRVPEGRVLEVLGDPYSPGVQIRMAIEQFGLARSFPGRVEQAAADLVELTDCSDGRKDLRYIRHVTIDGATAKDFDDAVAVQKTKNGFRLFVSIADVSHYVRPGSIIDQEAYRRGTSVYLPDLVLPMLPERLSNNLCSLVPDQDRPAFTAILEFDHKGNRTGASFTRSLIRSYQRFTYDTVNKIIYLQEQGARKQYKSQLPMLEKAGKLAHLLNAQRTKRGALGFVIPEAVVSMDGDHIDAIGRVERNQAHILIEAFMLAANEAVAETLDRAAEPVLYRVHEKPDPTKVEGFTEAARSMGLPLPKTEISPSWFARVLAEAHKSPAEYVVNNLLLRTMQRARYTPENFGHFGLAADYYLHFTSPIRRYPDLVVHRVLQNFLTKSRRGKPAKVLAGTTSLDEAGLFLSNRERVAVDIERNVQSRLAALFLRERVTEHFDAIISGVTSFGLFVELLKYFISGAVPIAELSDDYYNYDGKGHKLVGERTAGTYQMGDLIRVQLDHVDMISKRITFSIVDNEEQGE